MLDLYLSALDGTRHHIRNGPTHAAINPDASALHRVVAGFVYDSDGQRLLGPYTRSHNRRSLER